MNHKRSFFIACQKSCLDFSDTFLFCLLKNTACKIKSAGFEASELFLAVFVLKNI